MAMQLLEPFANDGLREDFDINPSPENDMSVNKGFTALFTLKPEEGGKFIDMLKFNQLLYLMSKANVEFTTQSFPNWIEDKGDGLPYAYPKNAIVKYTDGNTYISLIDNNSTIPTDTNNWVNFETYGSSGRIGLIDYGYIAKPYHIVAFGGEFNRADYPKLWAYLQANPTLVKTEAQWTTESTANGGICGFFSDGNGTTTFRVPNLDKAFLRPDSRVVGSFEEGSYISGDHGISSPNINSLINYDDNMNLFRERMNWDNLAPVKIGETNLKTTSIDGMKSFPYSSFPTSFGVTRPKNIAVLPLIVAK